MPGVLHNALAQSIGMVADIRAGKQAFLGKHRELLIEESPKAAKVTDSIDLDGYRKDAGPSEPRWDYLVGVDGVVTSVVAIEIHPARADEVPAMVRKKRAAQALLKAECQRDPVRGVWHWVASGKVDVSRAGSAERRLKEAGIAFPKTRLLIPRDLLSPA